MSPRTVAYMTTNQLPGGTPTWSTSAGVCSPRPPSTGWGSGWASRWSPIPPPAKVLCGRGEFGWGGAFSTAFWVAPEEDLVVLFFTQLLPSSTHPIRSQLKQLVYQAVVG